MNEVKLPSNWSDWKVDQYIGSGAYGNVYRAKRELGGKEFYSAIKIIQIPETDNEMEMMRREYSSKESLRLYYKDIVKSCVDEIKTMDLLKGCSHIVSIEDYQVEEDEDKIGWKLFIRMEYLQCFTEYIQTHQMSEKEVIKFGLDICEALEACEKMNVLHRDIKPDNVFVSPLGYVKLGDFGVARQLEKTRGAYSIKGTQTYMAPEVLRGAEYGKDTDIYSLGLVLYELMNKGRAPFIDLSKQMIYSRDKEEALFRRMGGEALPKPVEASDRFSAIILKACAYEPGKRYQNATDFKNDLQDLLQNKKGRSKVLRSKPRVEKTVQKPQKTQTSQKKSSGKRGLVIVALLLLAGIGLGGIFIWKQMKTQTKTLDVAQKVVEQKMEEQKLEVKKMEAEQELQEEEAPVDHNKKESQEKEIQPQELTADISACADFIIYETREGGSVEKFLFQKKLREALEKEKVDGKIAENIMKELTIQDFVMDYEKQIPKGTSVTMTFQGAERIKEKYQVTLVFKSITKDYS